MTRTLTPVYLSATVVHSDPLRGLVARIAVGDRAAFRTLYAFLAKRVWRDAIRLLSPLDARAVTRSTFVEVWHLAGYHLDQENRGTRAWVVSITARRVDDRIRTARGQSPHSDSYDQHTRCELTTLLGKGHATIRTAPANFTRVVGLAP